MKSKLLVTLLAGSTALGLLAVPALAQRSLGDLAPVTDEMLANPDPADWLAYGRASDNFRYSPLDQINTDNVNQLQLVWSRGTESGNIQISPIAYNGVLFTNAPKDVFQAIDAATGDLLWEYRRNLPDTSNLRGSGDRNRGIVVYNDKLYFMSWDNFLVALDIASGQMVWEIDRGQGTDRVGNTSGPIVANGVIVAGSTCQTSPFGCFITGHDAATGEELWRNTFIPQPGEEGDETWGNDFEARWMTGVWGQITYDPVLDLVFYGSSAVGPASEVQRGTPGGTLFGTNTRFAVRPETGEIVWRHQTLPRDNWDQECTYEMLVADIAMNPSESMDGLQAIGPGATGERRVHFGIPCKTGTFWAFDAEDGEFLYARDTAYQNLIDNIDDTGLVTVNEEVVLSEIGVPVEACPAFLGGRDWPPSAFNPETGIYYIPLNNTCNIISARDAEFTALDVYHVDQTYTIAPGATNVGRIDAINVATGETVWSYEQNAPLYAPVAVTAGGLVFTGGLDRNLKAIDSTTGELLWQARLGAGATGHPITYEVDGRQYVAIPSGDGSIAKPLAVGGDYVDFGAGAGLYVFALPQ